MPKRFLSRRMKVLNQNRVGGSNDVFMHQLLRSVHLWHEYVKSTSERLSYEL